MILEGQNDGPLSPSDIQYCTSVIRSEEAYVIRRLTSRCLERKQPSRVGGSPLCDVVSSFLCHTHTDGKDKLLEWPDGSCLLLYVSAVSLYMSTGKDNTKIGGKQIGWDVNWILLVANGGSGRLLSNKCL